MAKIFIAYRRRDSTYYVNAIQQVLEERFGKRSIVRDITVRIPLGSDFRKYLQDAVASSDAVLAVIGKQWLSSIQGRGDDETDFVRIEIEAALNQGIPVVPVIVGGAKLPRKKDLPESISDLVFRQAATIRSGNRLGRDIRDLADRLSDGLDPIPTSGGPEDLVLRISVKPKNGGIGMRFTWTVTVRNDGEASFGNIEVRRGKTLLEPAFSLDPHRGRQFKFKSRYRKPGKKTNSVSAVAVAKDGTTVRTGTKTSVEVH